MPNINDLWYAAKLTKIVYMPRKLLETFGETSVKYGLLTKVDDSSLNLRTGVVKAARPRIVTPQYLRHQALENFGPDAQSYFDDLISRKEGASIIEYGLCFQKEEYSRESIGGNLEEVAEQLAKDAQDNLTETRGVIIGGEKYWEISLVFFLKLLVTQSMPYNAREMYNRGLFAMRNGVPVAICNEIDHDFASATTREQADALGNKLRDYGLFEVYEDRFFEFYGRFC
ncbi:MAG: hypothetical protein J5833_03795 [Victivallales bacterium]|nr:hypothetical protein [Victivallales bacterium]